MIPILYLSGYITGGSSTHSIVWGWIGPMLSWTFSALWILPLFVLSKAVNSLWFQVRAYTLDRRVWGLTIKGKGPHPHHNGITTTLYTHGNIMFLATTLHTHGNIPFYCYNPPCTCEYSILLLQPSMHMGIFHSIATTLYTHRNIPFYCYNPPYNWEYSILLLQPSILSKSVNSLWFQVRAYTLDRRVW